MELKLIISGVMKLANRAKNVIRIISSRKSMSYILSIIFVIAIIFVVPSGRIKLPVMIHGSLFLINVSIFLIGIFQFMIDESFLYYFRVTSILKYVG